jgi:hypothetical protein
MLVLAGGLIAGTLDIVYACTFWAVRSDVPVNYVVVPLSAARPGPKDPLWIALSIAVHVLLIGIPIAIFAGRAVRAEIMFEPARS